MIRDFIKAQYHRNFQQIQQPERKPYAKNERVGKSDGTARNNLMKNKYNRTLCSVFYFIVYLRYTIEYGLLEKR